MSPFTGKNLQEDGKPCPPNLVLSLMTACSSAFPATGKEGETILAQQLSNLLQDKIIAASELRLLYTCRFGISVKDALAFIGFTGNLEEFVEQQAFLHMRNGRIRSIPAGGDVPKAGVVNTPLANAELLNDSHIEKPIFAGYVTTQKSIAEQMSTADTQSTTDSEGHSLEDDSDTDVIGSKVASEIPWKLLGSRLAAAFCTDDEDDDGVIEDVLDNDEDALFDVVAWSNVAQRVAAACKQAGDSEQPGYNVGVGASEACDTDSELGAWSNVGCRFAAALKNSARIGIADESTGYDADISETEDVTDDGSDLAAWSNVSCRFAAVLQQASEDDCTTIDPAAWSNVGCRFSAAFKKVSEDDDTTVA